MNTTTIQRQSAHYEVRFQSLFNHGRGLAFPCDSDGRVDLDKMNERLKNNYLFARAMVGREFATPTVQKRGLH